mgnify:CR=1 FL=1
MVIPLVFAASSDGVADTSGEETNSTYFEFSVKHALGVVHAEAFAKGNFAECVSVYARDAKFYIENKLVAEGRSGLLKFYRDLKENAGVSEITIERFIEIQHVGEVGWVIFNYTKKYDLSSQPADFLAEHGLEGKKHLSVSKFGTAIFRTRLGVWRIKTMNVYGEEAWKSAGGE